MDNPSFIGEKIVSVFMFGFIFMTSLFLLGLSI